MRHLAAYLMLVVGGNTAPTAADVTALLKAGGVEVDEERLNTLITDLAGKDINEVMKEGKEKLIPMMSGGGAAPAAAAGGAAPAAAAAAAPAAKPKEEVVDALEGGMNMFGGGDGGDY